MKAIILVGGQGTRLRPLTLTQPKPLLPILNRPFISYQLDMLKKAGVQQVVLAIGPQAQSWTNHLSSFKPKGLKIEFSIEKKPLGTGGGIRWAYERVLKRKMAEIEPIVVLNGDIFIHLNLRKMNLFHNENKAEATLAVVRVSDISRYGHVKMNSRRKIIAFLEKTGQHHSGDINAGAYLLNRSFVEKIKLAPCSIEIDCFPRFLKMGLPLYSFQVDGYWNDIGTPLTYLKAHADLWKGMAGKNFRKNNGFGYGKYIVGKNVKMGRNVKLEGMVCLGDQVRIGDECVIKDSIILNGCKVGSRVQMNKSILSFYCVIGDNALLSEGTLLGERSIITPFSKI